jgi:hypothetical protein
MRWVKHLPPGQHDNACRQLEHSGHGERNGVAAGQVVQRAKGEGSEREDSLIDTGHQRDDPRNIGRLELPPSDNRRQQHQIADTEPE